MNNNQPKGRTTTSGFTRRVVTATAAICFAAAAIALPARAQETAITVAYVPAGDFLPAYVAKEKGYFKERGLNVTFLAIPSIADLAGAVFSGAAQFGVTTIPGFIQATQGGLDLVAVAGASRMRRDAPVAAVLARPDSGIHGPADLVGKRVAVPGFRSFLDVIFRNWLIKNGVATNKVNFVEGIHPQMADLLRGNAVDAVVTIEPFVSFAASGGKATVVSKFVGDVNPDIVSTFWMAKRDWATSHPQAVKAFRDSWQKGIEYVSQNPQSAREIEKQYLKINSPTLPTFFSKLTVEDFDVYKKLMSNIGLPTDGFDAQSKILP